MISIWLLQIRRFLDICIQNTTQYSSFVPLCWRCFDIDSCRPCWCRAAYSDCRLQFFTFVLGTDCSEEFYSQGKRPGTGASKGGFQGSRPTHRLLAQQLVVAVERCQCGFAAEAQPQSPWFHTGQCVSIQMQNSTCSLAVSRIQSILLHEAPWSMHWMQCGTNGTLQAYLQVTPAVVQVSAAACDHRIELSFWVPERARCKHLE